jgi:hypothetical protein
MDTSQKENIGRIEQSFQKLRRRKNVRISQCGKTDLGLKAPR